MYMYVYNFVAPTFSSNQLTVSRGMLGDRPSKRGICTIVSRNELAFAILEGGGVYGV